jgi:hypothetical protein
MLTVGAAGVLISTKPSEDCLKDIVEQSQRKTMDEGMKELKAASMIATLFSGTIENLAVKQLNLRCFTYDYVFCKIGVLKYNTMKDNKLCGETFYTWGLLNGWTKGNQDVMKFIVTSNENMFRGTLLKIPLE